MKKRGIDAYVQLICYDMCQYKSAVTGKGRKRELVDCRRVICLICQENGFTEKEMAEVLNRDITTIRHLIDSGKFFNETYPQFSTRYQAIKRKLA